MRRNLICRPENRPTKATFFHACRGFSLIEILVAIVLIAIGLLGMAGLQSRLQLSEMEAYQRTQALLLLQDMSNRIATNRANAADYITGTVNALGTGHTDADPCVGSRREMDQCEWSTALKGAAERLGTNSIGAMVGGRGCVELIDPTSPNEYRITVAWQGLTPLSAPAVACGSGAYNGAAGSPCVTDLCRRVVTTVVRIGDLN